MRRITVLMLVLLFLTAPTFAHNPNEYEGYLPHDPNFMPAERKMPYAREGETQVADNPHYVAGTPFTKEQYAFFGFAPEQSRATAKYRDPQRRGQPQVSGSSIDKAWKIEKGDPAVVIAVIDTGFVFEPPEDMEAYAKDRDVADRLFLNKAELIATPPDMDPLSGLPIWDKYGRIDPITGEDGPDGRFSACDYKDWWEDGRIQDWNASGYLDPQDILHAGFRDATGLTHQFSDGIDTDNNGFIDDICGWDFFEDDNDPYDASSYATAKHHSRGQMALGGAQQDNGLDGSGVCPECTTMALRNWDSFVSDTNYYGTAVLYASRMGASAVGGAIGGMNNSGICKQAMKEAYDAGMTIFIVSSDLNTANHNFPTYLNEPISCSGIVPDTQPLPLPPTTYFRSSNMAQYGSKHQIAFEVPSGSESTAMSTGAGGLIISHAKRLGLRLHPDQVKQLLCMTAEDVRPENLGSIGTPDPAKVGWDQNFGYGRVDLNKALQWLDAGAIPPVARFTSPAWSAYLDPRKDTLALFGEVQPAGTSGVNWTIEAGYGIEPQQFTQIAQGTATGREFLLADVSLDRIKAIFPSTVVPTHDDLVAHASVPDPKNPWEADIQPNRHLFTVRLRVMDNANHVTGEDRRTFFLHEDQTLHAGWPQYIGVGGEGSVRFADLDGDNLKEVIVPSSDGRILVYSHDARLLHEFRTAPFDMITRHGLGGESYRPTLMSLSIGDIDADGIQEIMSAGGGRLYCFKATGESQPGFPVPFGFNFYEDALIKDAQNPQALSHDNHIEPGTMAAPVLYDINGDGRKEIILSAGDQRVYAWDADGLTLKGWPVYARRYASGGGIIYAPCIADINGDGAAELMVATNETLTSELSKPRTFSAHTTQTLSANIGEEFLPFVMGLISNVSGKAGLVYALKAAGTGQGSAENGRRTDTNAFIGNWPVRIHALLPDILPQMGPSIKPCAFDYNGDGRDDVVAAATSAKACIFDEKGAVLKSMDQGPMGAHAVGIRDRSLAVNIFASIALGDITGDGTPEIVSGGISLMGALNLVLTGQNLPYNHIVQAWDVKTGNFLDAYPRAVDDWVMFGEPALADVSGDGIPDVVMGTGLYLMHAFGGDGQEQAGFPKLNAGWVITTPAVEDIDNDGQNEMGVITREGWVFVWDTPGTANKVPAWPTAGHDNHNTSNLNHDATPPAAVTGYTWTEQGLTFTCPGDDGFAGRPAQLKVYGSNSPIDVTSIKEAVLLKTTGGAEGRKRLYISMPKEYAYYAIVAVDEAGNASQLPLKLGTIDPEDTDGSTGTPGSDSDDGLCFIAVAGR